MGGFDFRGWRSIIINLGELKYLILSRPKCNFFAKKKQFFKMFACGAYIPLVFGTLFTYLTYWTNILVICQWILEVRSPPPTGWRSEGHVFEFSKWKIPPAAKSEDLPFVTVGGVGNDLIFGVLPIIFVLFLLLKIFAIKRGNFPCLWYSF